MYASAATVPNGATRQVAYATTLSSRTASMSVDEMMQQAAHGGGVQTGSSVSAARTQKSRNEVLHEKKADPATYIVDSRKYASGSFRPLSVDKVTPEECADHYAHESEPPVYWYKNRFASCRAERINEVWETYQNGQWVPVGSYGANVAFVINMDDNARSGTVSVKLWDVRYSSGDVPRDLPVTFQTSCWDPMVGGPYCDPINTVFTKGIDAWEAAGTQTAEVAFPGESASRPDDPALNEHRSYYDFNPQWHLSNGQQYDDINEQSNELRCDVARTTVSPNYARTTDCIFPNVRGIFELDASDNGVNGNPGVAESARFIRDAQTNITSTYPGTVGSFVPGQYISTDTSDPRFAPLTRLYYDDAMRKANRDTSVAACVAHWGPNYTQRNDPNDPAATNDCDEYPFASTHEGSYSTRTATNGRSYAVRPLLSTQNQEAGNRLSQYMANDHVLEADPFYVVIIG